MKISGNKASARLLDFRQGSYCKDIATSCFCVWCSWCQMHRELRYRKKNTTVVVNIQPGAVNAPPGVVKASYWDQWAGHPLNQGWCNIILYLLAIHEISFFFWRRRGRNRLRGQRLWFQRWSCASLKEKHDRRSENWPAFLLWQGVKVTLGIFPAAVSVAF